MKLLSLVLLTAVSMSSFAQSNDAAKLNLIKAESSKIVKSFDDPEEPSLLQIVQRTRESFLKLNYSITVNQAYLCIAREMRDDGDRLATASQVLLEGYAAECLSQSLVKAGSAKFEYAKQKSEDIAQELQDQSSKPELLDSVEVSDFARKSFKKDGYSISDSNVNYCIAYEMRKDDERYATAYEVLRDGYAVQCFDKYLKSN